ncbi:YciI family protein, partial [Microbacterium sp. Leaf351]
MATFAVTYDYATDSDQVRDAHRPEHVAFLRGLHEEGALYMSGPLAQDPPRALLIFEAPDADALAARLDADPFHRVGAIGVRTIT